MAPPPQRGIRMAELVGVLSLVSDLGMGQPMEHALRQCRIAMRLSRRMGLEDQSEVVFYTGLLAWVGCHVDAYEQAKWFGDDLALKAAFRTVDLASPAADMAFMLPRVGSGLPLLQRARTGAGFVTTGMKDADVILANHSHAVTALAGGLGLDERVCRSIEQTFERWDGRGAPTGASGDEIDLVSRIVNLADVAEVFHRAGGVEAAAAVAQSRSGTQFDPDVVAAFRAAAPELLADLDSMTSWTAVIDAEPAVDTTLSEDQFDHALESIADFTDVKSPFTSGHSRSVADLAAEAADRAGLPSRDVVDIRRAGLLHDLGRMGVPNSIWDKCGGLTVAEAERVRLHPYLTARTLASSPQLAPLGAMAIQHHERLDGSGYPRGLRGDSISPGGRMLAAADTYHAMREPRPHRPAATADDAAGMARSAVRAGRLDGDAVEGVLAAAGHRPRRRREAVAGLTPREIEVLRLIARGQSTKEVARTLHITRKTAANHVEHIYTKLGVTNRAMASLSAARHGLLDAGQSEGRA